MEGNSGLNPGVRWGAGDGVLKDFFKGRLFHWGAVEGEREERTNDNCWK